MSRASRPIISSVRRGPATSPRAISLKSRAASAADMRLRFLPPSRKACSRPYASSQKVFWSAFRFE